MPLETHGKYVKIVHGQTKLFRLFLPWAALAVASLLNHGIMVVTRRFIDSGDMLIDSKVSLPV